MRILLVAYRFPPQTGGGVIRPAKMAKYMARAGVDVTVLTVRPRSATRTDESLLRDIDPRVRIVAVDEPGPFPRMERIPQARSRLERMRNRALVAARAAVWHWMVPDERCGFISAALAAARSGRIEPPDCILATGRPWSCFLAGERVARHFDAPLVLDYRDPWTAHPSGFGRPGGIRSRLANPAIERRLVRDAAAVVGAHQSLGENLAGQFRAPEVTRKYHWIPNGYDPEDFEGLTPPSEDRFVLTYAGSLYGSRSLEPVFRTVGRLREDGAIGEDIVVRVVGDVPPAHRPLDPSVPVDLKGRLPHLETLRLLLASTVNVLVDIQYEGPNVHTPGKLFEYLRAGRPILALTPEGVTADLVREAQGGWIVPPDGGEPLRGVLAEAYRTWKEGRTLPRPVDSVVERFDRRRSVSNLIEILRGISERGRAPGSPVSSTAGLA